MTRVVVAATILTWFIHAGASTGSAQELAAPPVVALDPASADLMRSSFPSMNFPVLVQVDDESFESLSARAWMLRDAGVLVFRSDRLSMISKLLRERLVAQGVRTVDLTACVSANRAFLMRNQIANPDAPRPIRRTSLATELVIDQARKTDPYLRGVGP